jgi:hypothetical protein
MTPLLTNVITFTDDERERLSFELCCIEARWFDSSAQLWKFARLTYPEQQAITRRVEEIQAALGPTGCGIVPQRYEWNERPAPNGRVVRTPGSCARSRPGNDATLLLERHRPACHSDLAAVSRTRGREQQSNRSGTGRGQKRQVLGPTICRHSRCSTRAQDEDGCCGPNRNRACGCVTVL